MAQRVMTPLAEDPSDDLLTPKAPSIAFPLANPLVPPEPQVETHLAYLATPTTTSPSYPTVAQCNCPSAGAFIQSYF